MQVQLAEFILIHEYIKWAYTKQNPLNLKQRYNMREKINNIFYDGETTCVAFYNNAILNRIKLRMNGYLSGLCILSLCCPEAVENY